MIGKIWGMVPTKYKAMALAIIAALVALSVYGYGFTRYAAGRASCALDQAEAALVEATIATTQREKIENETRRMDDDDIDRVLADHGWMRPYADR